MCILTFLLIPMIPFDFDLSEIIAKRRDLFTVFIYLFTFIGTYKSGIKIDKNYIKRIGNVIITIQKMKVTNI